MTKFKPSPETFFKEQDFRGLLDIHTRICAAIRARNGKRGDPPYLFMDLHGGPGRIYYPDHQEYGSGSPVIAIELLQATQMYFETIHYEVDPETFTSLLTAVKPFGSASRVYPQRFEAGVTDYLATTGRQPYRNGLVYSDPISEPIPVGTLNQIATVLPRVDLLAYVSATNQYKRANANGQGHGRRLADDVHAIDKKHGLIREPRRAEQYTFILWTNWTEFPEWRKRGFHSISSDQGKRILDELTWTRREAHDRVNPQLPFDDDPPYRSYREYLKHPRFLAIRVQVFERAGGLCERCGMLPPTEPHHLRYPPWGTFDVPENMIAVCHPCHCEIHGKAA